MTETKHSTLPWKSRHSTLYGRDHTIIDAAGKDVAMVAGPERRAENTEFIVRAVNSHGKLEAALKRIAEMCEAVCTDAGRVDIPDDIGDVARKALAEPVEAKS